MESKRKLVVHVKKPTISKLEPVETKASKHKAHMAWLESENRRYFNFPMHRDIGDAWCQMVVAMGEKPTDRLESILKEDIEKNGGVINE